MTIDPVLQLSEPTWEEVMKVRRYECSLNGHSWRVEQQFGKEDPVAVVCSHCGRFVAIGENVTLTDRGRH